MVATRGQLRSTLLASRAGRPTSSGSRRSPRPARRPGTSRRPAGAGPRPPRVRARERRPAAYASRGGRASRAGRGRLAFLRWGFTGAGRGDRSAAVSASSSSCGSARIGAGAMPVSTSTARPRTSASIQSRSADAGIRSSRSSSRRNWSSRSRSFIRPPDAAGAREARPPRAAMTSIGTPAAGLEPDVAANAPGWERALSGSGASAARLRELWRRPPRVCCSLSRWPADGRAGAGVGCLTASSECLSWT